MQRIAIYTAIALLIIIGLIVTEPWTYLVVNEVDEAFPELSPAQRDAVRAMPTDQKAMLIAMADENQPMAQAVAIAQTGSDSVVPQAQQAMPTEMPAEPAIIKEGAFIRIDAIHTAEGKARIYALPDGRHILRFEDFKSANGPDLHVYLSREIPKSTFASLGEGALHLGSLKGNVGSQNYEIPADVDIEQFQSAVIYCRPFSVIFSSAEFQPG